MATSLYDSTRSAAGYGWLRGYGGIRLLPGSFSQIEVVAVTANVMVDGRKQCLALGMDGYISKPIRIDALIETLEASSAVIEEMVN